MSDANNPEQTAQELRMHYSIKIQDIRDLKRNQWLVTYYGLALDSAIIGLTKVADRPLLCFEKSMLMLAAMIIFGICAYFLFEHQRTLSKYREQIVKTYTHFTGVTKQVIEIPPDYTSPKYFVSVVLLFVSVLSLGLIAVGWILFRPICTP